MAFGRRRKFFRRKGIAAQQRQLAREKIKARREAAKAKGFKLPGAPGKRLWKRKIGTMPGRRYPDRKSVSRQAFGLAPVQYETVDDGEFASIADDLDVSEITD
jgi:hypothetical protein